MLGVPAAVVLLAGALTVTLLLVRGTALGLMIEATGGNERAAALAGVDTRATIAAVYVWSGLCAAVAGLVVTGDIRGADANNAGLWLELDAILGGRDRRDVAAGWAVQPGAGGDRGA